MIGDIFVQRPQFMTSEIAGSLKYRDKERQLIDMFAHSVISRCEFFILKEL